MTDLEVADDAREGVRTDDGADDVVGGFDARHPVAHGFVDGVAERARAAGDGSDFGAQQFHAEDVEGLAADVFFAHVDDAVEAEVGAGGGGGDAVLAGAGFGDDALLAHAQGEQGLAEGVVDFVGAGVVEVFALEPDLRSAALVGKAAGVVEGRRASDVVLEERSELGLKLRVFAGFVVFDGELVERADERFGHVAAAEWAEAAGGVGDVSCGGCGCSRHWLRILQRLIVGCTMKRFKSDG